MHTKVEWDWNNLKIALVNLIRRFGIVFLFLFIWA
jgi:hypothetical protein